MTVPLFLSRLRLRPDPGFRRLGPVLFPDDATARAGVTHRLVWSLFPETLTERPFLYREMAPSSASGRSARGDILVLSTLRPEDRLNLFELETKPFEPALSAGNRLGFSLRANPAFNRRDADGRRTRSDIVMHALYEVPHAHRAERRPQVIREAGLAWLSAQGETAGFCIANSDMVAVDGYEQIDADPNGRGPRPVRGRRPGHMRLDFEGIIEVTDPALLVGRIATGFGRARAFGHGLMLIRRA